MMISKKSKFEYKGPVTSFDRVITESWIGVTWAPSEAKALANLSYQYKKEHNLIVGTRIDLSADFLREVSSIEDGIGDGYDYIIPTNWKEVLNESI